MSPLWIGVVAALVLFLFWFWRTGRGREGPRPEATGSTDEERTHGPPPEETEGFTAAMGTVVLLRDNEWDACVVDGIKEDWKRYGGPDVRGFAGVAAGRHQVVTTTAAGEVTLDFVLYPGEIYVRRLDADTKTWQLVDEAVEATDRDRARGGSMGKMADSLVSYRTTFGIARVMAGAQVKSPDAAVDLACVQLDELLKRALADQPADTLVKEAYEIGRALIGVPMTRAQLATIIGPIGKLAHERAAASEHKRGALLASLGLAVLPDEPYLLESLACMLAGSGLLSDALTCVENVLRRDMALDDDTRIRARAVKAEVLCKLGRTEEARALADALHRDRPSDAHVLRVHRLVTTSSAN